MTRDFIYYKASMIGLFSKKNQRNAGYLNYADIKWHYLFIDKPDRIELADYEALKAGDYWYADKIREKRWYRPTAYTTELLISGASKQDERVLLTGDLHKVLLRDFRLQSDSGLPDVRSISNDMFEMAGTVYFAVPKEQPVKNNALLPRSLGRGLNVFRPILRPAEKPVLQGGGKPVDNPLTGIDDTVNTVTERRGCLPRAVRLLLYLFLFGAAFYLWEKHPGWAAGLVLLGLAWLLLRKNIRRVLSFALGALLLLSVGGFWLYQIYSGRYALQLQETRKGEVKVMPPKEDTQNSRTNERDFLSEKKISWWDFRETRYDIAYQTSSLRFLDVQRANLGIRNIAGRSEEEIYTRIYRRMVDQDSKHVDSVASILKKKAAANNLNLLQTAEMVTTMIQEIPYCLVHDQSCREIEAQASGFVADYHRQNKPCLPDIPGGLQSPYQFIHNLKGDCDTRSVFGHLLLAKLGIHSSVWVSVEYGHSVLGVALPVGSGNYKTIDGVRHYGVELTAKGFRLGMIAPEHRNMHYWKTTIYN